MSLSFYYLILLNHVQNMPVSVEIQCVIFVLDARTSFECLREVLGSLFTCWVFPNMNKMHSWKELVTNPQNWPVLKLSSIQIKTV